MPVFTPSPDARDWKPLPAEKWDADHARHLLRRAGWSAQPAEVDRAVQDGMVKTLNRLFPRRPQAWPAPAAVTDLWQEAREKFPTLRSLPPEERSKTRNDLRQKSREATQQMALAWMQRARDPEQAAFEKWVFFLEDVYVVAEQKVRNAMFLYQHQDLIRAHAMGPAPALTKAISRSPAMIMYLDLQGSRRAQPNENFARELFELFVLGEGHYTEADIKEAARAFVGYRQVMGEFQFARRQADPGRKTVFGESGRLTGDDVIDIAYRQPAARTFLPAEMVRYYLTADGLDRDTLEPLGDYWHASDYDLRALLHRFFGSELFYAEAFRGNYIKSPIQFSLGLAQDLGIDPLPVPRFTLNTLRGMGQSLFDPPNVRGWVGGQNWINSTTLAARRNAVNIAINGVPERVLNADDKLAIEEATAAGRGPFTPQPSHLRQWIGNNPAQTARNAASHLLPNPVPDEGLRIITNLLRRDRAESSRQALQILLSVPDYNLC